MKSAKYIDWLNFGQFKGDCLFVCGFDFDYALNRLKKTKAGNWILALEDTEHLWDRKNWGFASKRVLTTDETFFFLVIKDRFDFSDSSQRKLAHECLHLASFHLKDLLDPIKENECFAYMHTYLMEQCHKILRG